MWFSGPVAQAVTKAKTEKQILLVFVEDDTENSKDMGESWADTDVQQLCKDEQFVCLKIHGTSENFKFFSQYYPVVTFPMSFFIGPNGKPIEILTGPQSPAHLIGKIREVSQIHRSQFPLRGDRKQTEAKTSVTGSQPSTSNTTTSSPKSDLPLDHKVEKAKELLAAQRLAKAKQQEEEERQKEMQRRQQGKEIADLKQKQKEMEIKEIAEERRKAKQADKEALRKIREQIEADRRDKAVKYDQKKSAEEAKHLEDEARAKEEKATKEAAELAAKSTHSRIQFRIPSMPVINEKFPADDQLQVVHSFVAQNVPFTDFTLIQMYPRREFTSADLQKTLRELELIPTSVLIVVPPPSSGNFIPKGNNGGFSFHTLVQWLFYPLTLVYSLVIGLFFGGTGRAVTTGSEGSRDPRPNRNRPNNSSKDVQRGTTGNVSRLTDLPSDDDDTATWNGNSTQQL